MVELHSYPITIAIFMDIVCIIITLIILSGASLLSEAIHGTAPETLLQKVQSKLSPEAAGYLQKAIDNKTKAHVDVVKEFGSHCGELTYVVSQASCICLPVLSITGAIFIND